MSEKKKTWAWFVVGLLLGTAGTAGVVVAQDCRPTVEITEAVLDKYCAGREPHVCPSPCPAPTDCPSPCPTLDVPGNCTTTDPEIRIVPADVTSEGVPLIGWGEEGVDWTYVQTDTIKFEVDWTAVTAPTFDQAAATFAFRWKEDQAWRPVIAASWTEGTSGSEVMECTDLWNDVCTKTTLLEIEDDWRVLLGVGGTFGR